MDARRRLITLVGIMVAVSLFVVLFAIYLLYETSFAEEDARLAEAAKSHARLIEAVARFDSVHSRDAHPDGWKAATLGQVIDAPKLLSVLYFAQTVYAKLINTFNSIEFSILKRSSKLVTAVEKGIQIERTEGIKPRTIGN